MDERLKEIGFEHSNGQYVIEELGATVTPFETYLGEAFLLKVSYPSKDHHETNSDCIKLEKYLECTNQVKLIMDSLRLIIRI